MPNTQPGTQPQNDIPLVQRRDTVLQNQWARLYTRIIQIGFFFIVAGGLGELLFSKKLPHGAMDYSELLSSLAAFEPKSFLAIGLLILILGPFAGLCMAFRGYWQQHDYLLFLVTTIVMIFVLLGIPLERMFGG